MAKKKDDEKVVRISAKSEPKTTVADAKQQSKATKKAAKPAKKKRTNPLKAIGGYFKGAWSELSQVRWPNRRATWGLTGAVLAFSAFFVVFIVLLDLLFQFIFEQLLG